VAARDHGDPGDAPSVPPPLTPIANATRPSAAEEARTIAASTNTGTLASLTTGGDPWASLVAYGLHGGAPVLCVSNLAEHGRNLADDPRASIAIVAPTTDPDPLANARITLAGVAERPTGDELTAARAAHLAGVPAAKYYVDYSDFTLWVLRVDRVRWVGGYGRMDSATGESYAGAQPDPVAPVAAGAIVIAPWLTGRLGRRFAKVQLALRMLRSPRLFAASTLLHPEMCYAQWQDGTRQALTVALVKPGRGSRLYHSKNSSSPRL